MKNKVPVIALSSLFLAAVGAFYYKGEPEKVVAYEASGRPTSDREISIEETLAKRTDILEKKGSVAAEDAVNSESKVEEMPSEIESEVIKEGSQTPEQPKENVEPQQMIDYNGTLYEKVTEDKFKHWITVASKYGAEVYAVPSSDVFGFFKGNEIIIGISTGVASADPDYSQMLKELFSGEKFLYEGVTENIEFVKKTGATVSVHFPEQNQGYTIYKNQGGRIILSW